MHSITPTMTNVSGSSGGTGSSLAQVTVIVAGVASLVATLISLISIWLQTKNYRKPLLQRYVVRILLMVPIYSVSSWVSIVSLKASAFIAPIRDIYEAFTIYTFFQLLINLVGGERALIVMTHGRAPVQHAWPLNHFLRKVDISDPHTFLAIKRGILQYAWLKPILALASIIMKATGTYQEGYLGLSSGYLWTGIIYNISVTLSLYSLAMFWVCMHDDLKPFRPVPKFLCVKLIIFASYWQGFFLSILQWLGALPNGVAGYSPDNLAAAIQDSLICFEMPIFALTHWYAFSWHDYADASVSAARMPVKFAIRDAFGIRDLIEDTKETFRGENYQYRLFDSGDNVIAHEESESRLARVMDGMRYERGGKAKYWIPKPGKATSRTPLLSSPSNSRRNSKGWSKRGSANDGSLDNDDLEDMTLNEEDERLFTNARALEFGDYNYPVITANEVPPDQRLPRRTRHSVSNPARNNTESSYVKRAAKHRNRRIHNNEASESSSGRRSNRKSKHSVNGNKEHSSSSISPQSRLRRSQLIDLVDDVGETERERFGAPGEQQNIAKEACLVDQPVNANGRYESIEGRRMVEQPTEQLRSADEDNEADTESLAGRNMAYGSFNEERDAWGG
ncbi:DUF300 domain-containing protein [Histoplasma capsulatum G186AR]|uniref:DUF300 domain-containing protein n=1 Tax=Ajellomyces capsulatus TaxID=5037 RepID=A0A8H8D4Y0_AJECA|nr:DUF300 domain-containing protein [Histoplasma capsulatum]QSS67443.1 DUF300 domain-containing protein [Histoplasma capsulatum G186AR]